MSDFNYQPAYGAQQESRPRVLMSSFGDGYEQRAADGLNPNLPSWLLTFNVETVDALIIKAFFELKNGVTSFTWTPSGESEIRVVCQEWSRIRSDLGVQAISATFRQVLV